MTRQTDDSRQGHHRSGVSLPEVHTPLGSGWGYGVLLFLMAGAILGAAIATLNRASDVLVGPLEGVQVDMRGHLTAPAPLRVMMVIPSPGPDRGAFNPADELLIWRRTMATLPLSVTETSLSDLPQSPDQAEVLLLPAHTALTSTHLTQLSSYLLAGGGILGGPALSPLLEPLWQPAPPEALDGSLPAGALPATNTPTASPALRLVPSGPPWLAVPLLTPRPLRVNQQALEASAGAHVVRFTRSPAVVWHRERVDTTDGSPSPASPGPFTAALVLASAQELFSASPPTTAANAGRLAWMDFPLSQVYGNPSSTTILQPMLQRLIPWLAGRPLAFPLPTPPVLEALMTAPTEAQPSPIPGQSVLRTAATNSDQGSLLSNDIQSLQRQNIQIQRLREDRLHLHLNAEHRASHVTNWVIILPPRVEVTEVISHRIPSPTLTWKQVTSDEMHLQIAELPSGESLDVFIGLRRQ